MALFWETSERKKTRESAGKGECNYTHQISMSAYTCASRGEGTAAGVCCVGYYIEQRIIKKKVNVMLQCATEINGKRYTGRENRKNVRMPA